MQIRRGKVAVTSGSPTVRGVYVANVTGVVGTFLLNEGVTWGSSGVGVVVRHDTIGGKLLFTRSSGEYPTPGVGFVNTGATKAATCSSLASDSTPNFTSELVSTPVGALFSVQESGVLYSIASSTGVDFVTLAGNYAGTTNPEAAYWIVRDFSAHFGVPLPRAGDIDLPSIAERAIADLDSNLYGTLKTSLTLSGNWSDATLSDGEYWKDADRMVHLSGAVKNTVDSVPSVICTLPAGYRPSYTRRFACAAGDVASGVVEINVGGTVTAIAGPISVALYLDNIHFRAEA